MPNWCSNIVTLAHTDRSMISRAVKAAQKDSLFNEFVPCPEALSETTEGSFSDPVEQEKLDNLREHNRKTYGYSSWYDFAIGEWGSKWDMSNSSNESKIQKTNDKYSVVLYFDTAWNPPINFYNKLIELDFEVNAMYHEPGVAFCGQYFNGQDETFELVDLNSEEVKELIPEELDNTFAISEQIAEYEAEQNE